MSIEDTYRIRYDDHSRFDDFDTSAKREITASPTYEAQRASAIVDRRSSEGEDLTLVAN